MKLKLLILLSSLSFFLTAQPTVLDNGFSQYHTASGSNVFYTKYNDLWVTDGTVAGTGKIQTFSGNLKNLTDVNGKLFYSVNGSSATELWKSDGTSAGTIKLYQFAQGDFLQNFINVNGILFFLEGTSTLALYKTDGTASGTSLIDAAVTNYPTPTKAGNLLYYQKSGDLWRTDGTELGTFRLGYFYPDSYSTSIYNMTEGINGNLYFSANGLNDITKPFSFNNNNRTANQQSILFKSDGTIGGTVPLVNGTVNGQPYHGPGCFGTRASAILNGFYYFIGNDGVSPGSLWRTDGTSAGTSLVYSSITGSTWLRYWQGNEYLANVNGSLLIAGVFGTDIQLWKSDGTRAGTTLIKTIGNIGTNTTPVPAIYNPIIVGGQLFFGTSGSSTTYANDIILNFFKTDLTTQGTGPVDEQAFVYNNGATPPALVGNTVYYAIFGTKLKKIDASAPFYQALYFNTALPSYKSYGDASFTTDVLSTSGLATSISSSNPAVATTDGNTITIVGAGTTTITASQSGNARFAAAASLQKILTVSKVDQTITFTPLPATTFGAASFTLSGSSTSGLGVSYSSSNTSVATVSGNTITIVGAGSSTITASQAGNSNYNAARNVQQTLTISKADQTISFGTLPVKKNGDAAFTISATASSGLSVSFASSNTSVATVSGNTVTIVGVGTTNITASQAGNTNYNVAPNVAQVLSVTSTVNPILSIMQGNTKIASNGTYNFGNVSMLSNSGDVAFTVSNLGNAVLNLDIANSTLTGTNAADFSVDLSALSQPVTTNSFQSKIKFTPTGAGVRTAKISILSNDPVNNPYIINLTGTGVKLNQSITFGALASRNVTDAVFALTATATSQLPVSYASSNTAVATINGSTVTIVGAGTTTITASQTGNDNYNAATSVTQTLTVTAKQSQTITFAALPTKTFGDAAFTLSASSSSQLAVSFASSNTEVATISGNTITIVGAGISIITASQAGNDTFNPASNVTQTLTVNKASQVITFAALPAKLVTDAAFTLSASGGASGLPVTFVSSNTAVATISGSTVTIIGAGSTNITASQAGNANYNAAADVVQVLTVTAKQNQTITFAALADKTLGETAFALTATASSGLTVAYSTTSDKITISGSQVTLVKAGRASIVANQAGNDAFNAATAVTQSFCIKPVKPIITLSNNNTETVTLTSSATTGNQWYLAGVAISGATNATLAVTAPGIYKVQAKVDDCASEFSADQTILVTGDIKLDGSTISISPNPVDDVLQLNGIVGEIKSNHVLDVTGRTATPLTLEKKNEVYQASVEHLNQGVYVLRILQENKVVQVKFVKK